MSSGEEKNPNHASLHNKDTLKVKRKGIKKITAKSWGSNWQSKTKRWKTTVTLRSSGREGCLGGFSWLSAQLSFGSIPDCEISAESAWDIPFSLPLSLKSLKKKKRIKELRENCRTLDGPQDFLPLKRMQRKMLNIKPNELAGIISNSFLERCN